MRICKVSFSVFQCPQAWDWEDTDEKQNEWSAVRTDAQSKSGTNGLRYDLAKYDDQTSGDDDGTHSTTDGGIEEDREGFVDDHVGEEEADENPVTATREEFGHSFGVFALMRFSGRREHCDPSLQSMKMDGQTEKKYLVGSPCRDLGKMR